MKKKRFIFCCALVICCIFGGAANAKNVYYETFNDGKTGRQIEYFDLYEDTTRNYFTQNAWFSDNKSFIVCGESDGTIYKYDTLTKSVDEVFGAGCLPLDNAAVVGPDDTVYARNKTSNDIYMQKPTSGQEEFEPLSMTLPLASGYESNTTSTSNSETATSQQYSDGSGLTFGFYTNDRWNEGMTLARQKGGKWCRTTIARNTDSGLGWYEIYNWDSSIKPNLRSTFMSFKVDNSKISADTRNVTIEFDYFDNSDSAMSGQYVELTYLATDSQKKTVRVAYTQTGEWKTARFDLTDAQFDHRSSGALQGGYTYDFRIGSGGNRGGFASSWIKVYPTALEELNAGLNGPMPEHETYGEVNADGTALTGDVVLSIWDGSYDRDIGFSGKDGRAAVNGKHYIYNREYAKYNESGQGWKRWKNAFCVNVPDDFLYGTDYEKVEIEVECYLTAGSIQFNFGGNDNITNNVPYNEWTTTKVVIDPSSGRSFSNGVDGVDFKIFSTGCEGYIHKITVRKDIIED